MTHGVEFVDMQLMCTKSDMPNWGKRYQVMGDSKGLTNGKPVAPPCKPIVLAGGRKRQKKAAQENKKKQLAKSTDDWPLAI